MLACLVVKDELLGFIAINGRFSGEDYSVYDCQLLSVMAQHISFSLHSHMLLMKLMHKYNENKGLYENLRRIYYDTIHAFAASIDAKDSYTRGHSHRVSAYSAVLAREMGWANEDVEGIRIAGLLHDIGKIAVDKTIINKASPLTSYECRELNSHPVVGYEILSKIKFPWKGIPMMTRNHHEKVDGSGYPDRLKKSDIPMGARIMALVDAFDAMTTDRPYRPRLSFREAMDEVRANFNKQFDPDVVQPFITVIRKEVRREVDNPTIVPLLQEQLDSVSLNRMLEGFPIA
jgi:putative nucleotidyltransferase with HDIG domain